MKRWIGATTFVFLLSAWVPFGAAQNQALVIDGGTLIDGTGRAPVKDAVVVIEGERIKAVGKKGEVQVPSGAKVISGAGKTILPGLIDAHIHTLDFFPQLFPHYGVTTVMDTANPTEWIVAMREALKKGKMKGPRMFVTGVVVDGPDKGTADKRNEYLVHVNTPDEARAKVRELIKQGVDAIKVYQGLTPDLLKAIMDEVHKNGMEAVGHSHDAKDSVAAGLKFIEHSTPIAHSTINDPAKLKAMDAGTLRVPEAEMDTNQFGAIIDLFLKNGIYYNPTITREFIAVHPKRDEWNALAARIVNDPSYRFIPAARRETWQRLTRPESYKEGPDEEKEKVALRKVEEFTRRYAQAGGKIIAGPDSGPSSGPSNMAGLAPHIEMEALVDAGLTPMQALLTTTKWPAELMHKEKDLGTVETGKIADVILIEGDPLADIRNTRNVRTVIQAGKVVDTTLDPSFRNAVPRTTQEYTMDYRGPDLTTIAPVAAGEGGGAVEIELTGKKFTPKSIVRFDITDLPTKFVSETKLTATVGAALLKTPGTFAVTVVNPGSGGGTSREQYFIVNFK